VAHDGEDGTGAETRPRLDRGALAAFLGAAVLASGNAVAIKVSLGELQPLWSATLRFALASVVLAIVMTTLRMPWPRGHELSGAVVFGALGLAATFGLANYALLAVPAGAGQTILALVPLATLLIAVAVRQERLTVATVAGAVIAVVGVAVVYLRGVSEPIPMLSLLAVLGAVLTMSAAAVFVRRFPPVHPVAMNAVAVVVASVLLLLGTLLAGEDMAVPRLPKTLTALGYLGVAGSVATFSLMLVVLKHWSASRTNYVLVVVPAFTIPVAAWVLGEEVPATLLWGGVIIVGGVYLGALRGK
jgi:drug/metabolite transporter (DMT)-like permease